MTSEIAGFTYDNGVLRRADIPVARESPYTLFVNDHEILSIATLPCHLAELFTGFLVAEGVLLSPREITECDVDHGNRLVRFEIAVPDARLETVLQRGMLTSGCAGGMIFSRTEPVVSPREASERFRVGSIDIIQRMRELSRFEGLYRITRGVHASSVATREQTIMTLEDLGRHNAVDKIIGYCFLNGVATRDKLLLTTGRVTSEVVTKASRANFSVVVSKSSASSMAVALAKQVSIDIVSYVKGNRFNYFPFGGTELLNDVHDADAPSDM